jgi:hypothetical protein
MTSNSDNNVSNAGYFTVMSGLLSSAQSRWEGSKGPEMLSGVTAHIPQGTKDYVLDTQKRLFNPQYLRSPSVYFGFGEQKAFFIEKNPALLYDRIKHNLMFFYLNYVLITVVLFFLTLLISPSAIIGMGLLGLAWVSVMKATQSGSLTLRGITITQRQASIFMSISSACVLFYILNRVFWWTLSTSAICVGMHILFRDASMHKDEEDKVPMSGDLGEDAAFLNSNDDQA